MSKKSYTIADLENALQRYKVINMPPPLAVDRIFHFIEFLKREEDDAGIVTIYLDDDHDVQRTYAYRVVAGYEPLVPGDRVVVALPNGTPAFGTVAYLGRGNYTGRVHKMCRPLFRSDSFARAC